MNRPTGMPSQAWMEVVRFLLGCAIVVSEVLINRGGIRAEAFGAVAMCWFYGTMKRQDEKIEAPPLPPAPLPGAGL